VSVLDPVPEEMCDEPVPATDEPVPATDEQLASICGVPYVPYVPYGAPSSGEPEPETCSICMEELAVGVTCIRLKCNHPHHAQCMTQWMRHGNNCPVCRYSIGDIPSQPCRV